MTSSPTKGAASAYNHSRRFIESYYGLRVKRGTRGKFKGRPFTVTWIKDSYLYVKFDGEARREGPFHATWEMEWPKEVRLRGK